MSNYWLTQDLLKAASFGFLALAALGVVLALWLPKKWWQKGIALAVVLLLISIPVRQGVKDVAQEQKAVYDYKERYAKAKALFDERCKTAGEKIYKTVDNVEGVLLLNIRQSDRPGIQDNPLWPDAALPQEAGGDDYIRNFLYWEHRDEKNQRGQLSAHPRQSTSPGYRFVDVRQTDGAILRYRLNHAGSPALMSALVRGKPYRYAVGFVNQVIPEDRAHWVAGTTITVTDTQTKEVIATRESYSFEPGLGSHAGGRQPWMFAVTCPSFSGWDSGRTRFFVDQILKPKQGE